MPTPAFQFQGGKARLRKWLLSHFPKAGRWYVEPFAGRGNVYFGARAAGLSFSRWLLTDQDTNFLRAVRDVDLSLLPAAVSKEDFPAHRARIVHLDPLRADPDDPMVTVSRAIEPRISFCGKGYRYGYGGSYGTHVGYSGVRYAAVLGEAKRMLADAEVATTSWECLTWRSFEESDFLYLDPPYHGTESPYPNINHEGLIGVLNKAKCRWAISGYASDLYDGRLRFKRREVVERNSEIKGLNTGKKSPITEVLWTNY